jgi:hypothetical protein
LERYIIDTEQGAISASQINIAIDACKKHMVKNEIKGFLFENFHFLPILYNDRAHQFHSKFISALCEYNI